MSGKLFTAQLIKLQLHHPPKIKTCVHWIAKLGGFLGRKRDGEPGVKTIWQGLRRLHDIANTWILAESQS